MARRWMQPTVAAVWLSTMAAASFAADPAPFPTPAPVVYVADFDLDVANVKPDSGPGSRLRRLGSALPSGPLRQSKDPQTQAKEIVADMADDLIADLTKAGIDARRLPPGAALPATGWQVRGVFLSVDEGNRLQRAMVGFGAGQSNFQVAVSLDDLSNPTLPPLYENTEEGSSKDKPGAFIKLNPYVIAAKFVMAGHDQKSTIKNTAQQISDSVVEKLKAKAQ
ncbi:DUF4410 domain-containing protein [Paraburkholderia phenazinium]|uniref:DUF4410 domain-containing protein n=1 Tax=Paraburkholderia phenazinium TaxID=60549 RepID=A0A1G8M611_9BURK|nr:DUF4410 domain-containing protein [Paraburkholderia phenazinium]SDI62800.1 protein of unknown function [Paraburkholderia phenazinium]